MRRILHSGLKQFEIFLPGDARPKEVFLQFHDEQSALRFLRLLRFEALNQPALQDTLADAVHLPLHFKLGWDEILQQLAEQVVRGHIRIANRQSGAPSGLKAPKAPAKEEAPEEAEQGPPPPPPPPPEPLKWIEFSVIDDTTKKGRGDAVLAVKLGKNNPQNFPAKVSGLVRIDRLASGTTCNIEKITASEILEVISIA